MIEEQKILEAICLIYDPEIPVNIYELGLIYDILYEADGKVVVEMTLTTPSCPSAQELPVLVKEAVESVSGVKAAEVRVVWDPPWSPDMMGEDARLALNMF